MRTYLTLGGQVLDLTNLAVEELAYLDECLTAYHSGESFEDFSRDRTFSARNPALAPHARVNAQNVDHPLLRAVFDLEARLGIRDGVFGLAPGHDASTDPMTDTALAVTAAANEKGVTRETVYNAIERGELVATAERPVKVSANSLRGWQPAASRQRAGRLSAASRGR
ncbi:MAG: hypothetical protein WD557_00185 [Dehalococcoidia bacterium]